MTGALQWLNLVNYVALPPAKPLLCAQRWENRGILTQYKPLVDNPAV